MIFHRYCSTIHSNAQSMENSQQDLTSVKTSLNSTMDKIKDIRSIIIIGYMLKTRL